ncbi:hypothetical protein RFI_38576, partial [Reticulomyxa filosa]
IHFFLFSSPSLFVIVCKKKTIKTNIHMYNEQKLHHQFSLWHRQSFKKKKKRNVEFYFKKVGVNKKQYVYHKIEAEHQKDYLKRLFPWKEEFFFGNAKKEIFGNVIIEFGIASEI